MKGLLLAGTGLLVLLFVSVADAVNPPNATLMVNDRSNNPAGGVGGNLFGVNWAWEVTGVGNDTCSDYGPYYTSMPLTILNAIATWEMVLPGTQFKQQQCYGGTSATTFKRRSVSGWDCPEPSMPACEKAQLFWDAERNAW